MKAILVSTILTASLFSTGYTAETPDFDRLKESYKAAMDKAVKGINQTYLASLIKIRDEYARSTNLEAANKVQSEIDRISLEFGLSSGSEGVAETPNPVVPGNKMKVEIPANDVNGFQIGLLKKGTSITLSYVVGKWKDSGKIPSDNPDAEFTEKGDNTRLVIANGKYKSRSGPVLTMVPAGTAAKPFTFTLAEDVENVVLRINEEGGDYELNPGAVTYTVTVTP